jgi:hypothetical protein
MLVLSPANAYLNELPRDRRDVLPLAFHVTCWDRLGWKDPFSLETATERQDRYGHRFGDGPYTPEIVVDGATSHVGSHRQDVGSAIERAKKDSPTAANINVTKDGGRVSIEVGSGSGSGRVLLIRFDHEHRTAIGRGENAGRTLDKPMSFGRSGPLAIGPERHCASAKNFPKVRTLPSFSRPRMGKSSARRACPAALPSHPKLTTCSDGAPAGVRVSNALASS